MATTQGRPKTFGDVLHMAQEVGQALLQGFQVLGAQVGLGDTAVVLQGPHRGHHHHRVGVDVRHAALDVQEFLRPQVGAEAGLGDRIVPQFQGRLGGHDGVAAVGDVGKGPPWMRAGVPSSVWTRLGFSASFSRAVMAPAAFRSPAVTGLSS